MVVEKVIDRLAVNGEQTITGLQPDFLGITAGHD